VKHVPDKTIGEREILRMVRPPFQFLCADFWGAGPE
jgi:hypothetical protein